jgi:hypothetical protein
MKKEELLGVFRTCENNCKLAYASMVLFAYEDTSNYYSSLHKELSFEPPYCGIDELLKDEKTLKIASGQLYDSVHMNSIRDLFELTKKYCKKTNQQNKLTAMPWYQFWRILRNCFSHNFKFEFDEYDQKKLPVSWGGVTIDVSFEGRNLTHGNFSREKIWVFLSEVREFIAKELT